MTRSLFDSPVIICFFIQIQCQGWLSGRSGSEALGSEALISQSTGLGRIEASNMADGLRRAEFKGAGLGLEVLEWLGYAGAKAMGSLRDAFSARKGGVGQGGAGQECAGQGGAGQKTAG